MTVQAAAKHIAKASVATIPHLICLKIRTPPAGSVSTPPPHRHTTTLPPPELLPATQSPSTLFWSSYCYADADSSVPSTRSDTRRQRWWKTVEREDSCGPLGMVYFVPQKCIEEGFASGLLAAAVWLNGDKYCVDLCKLLRIIEAHNPATVRFVVHVQNA